MNIIQSTRNVVPSRIAMAAWLGTDSIFFFSSLEFLLARWYSRTSTNDHLCTTASPPQRPFFVRTVHTLIDYEQPLVFLSQSSKTRETRKWPNAWRTARDERGTLVSRGSPLRHFRARALLSLNLKKNRDCSQSNTFTLVSTSLQWPLSSFPKVAVVKRFNCIGICIPRCRSYFSKHCISKAYTLFFCW